MADATEKLLQDYYEAWGTGDADRIAAFFTPDAVFEDLAFAAVFSGHDAIRAFVGLTFAGIPDFKVAPESIVHSGDRAAAAWTMTGTHGGDLPGFPATHRTFRVRASSIIELRGGKIARMTDYWSPDAFRREVGLLPSD